MKEIRIETLLDMIRYNPVDTHTESRNDSETDGEPVPFYGFVASSESLVAEDPELCSSCTMDHYSSFSTDLGLHWDSLIYDDGTLAEALFFQNIPHGKGVFTLGHLGCCGILTGASSEDKKIGDMFDGELIMGFSQGFGKYSNITGKVYTGEYVAGLKIGCGITKDFRPYIDSISRGKSLKDSWITTVKDINNNSKSGAWVNDLYHAPPQSDFYGSDCTENEIAGVVEEALEVSLKSKFFRFKPDGMFNLPQQTEENGVETLLQDPLTYPYESAAQAPGPLSQLYPIRKSCPSSVEIIRWQAIWRNIHDTLTFEVNPEPDSTLAYVLEMWSGVEERSSRRKRSNNLNTNN